MMRKRIEELFGAAKEFMGLRRAKFRRTIHVREQVLLTATTQNIKRMVRLLSRTGPNREGEGLVKELKPFFGAARHCVSWLCDFWKTNDLFCCSTT